MAEQNQTQAQASFMKSLFFGQMREDLIFPYPKLKTDVTDSVRMVVDTIDKFGKEHVKAAEWDEKGAMPREIVSHMAELGMLGIAVPEEHGGLGFPQSGYARIMQELARLDGALAVTAGAHQSIGYKALLLFGSDEQKKRLLPRLASGELIACYCLTEPSSGSDAASIKTTAKLSPDGKTWILNGNKLWITNGGIANFFTVFAKTESGEKDPKTGKPIEKVTAFMVEGPTEGVTVGPPEHKLGIRASWTNAVHFDNVKVSAENVLRGPGEGFKVAMGVLNHGRLGLAAGCVGTAKNALKAAVEHANERIQFKKKIGEFGMIKEKIGRMMMNIYVAESMVYMTTALIDRGDIDYSLESSASKIFASEMCWEAVDENVQVWAGLGFMKEYPYERWLRDARINRIFEGTNEVLRAFVALSGMQGPGEELAGLADAIRYPLQGLGLVTGYVGRQVKNRMGGASVTKAHPQLAKMTGQLEEAVSDFAIQVDVLLRRHGREIHLRQFAQKRIADIAIDLYAMSCVLSRVSQSIEKKGAEKSEMEIKMAEAFFMRAGRRISENSRTIDRNDDDQIKWLANQAYEMGSYPFDAVLDT